MLSPNQVLSKEMQVKPLAEGEIAVYRLCASDEVDMSRQDEETGKFRTKSPGYTLAKKYTVYDKVKAQKVLIGNVIGVEMIELEGREPYRKDKLGHVRFEMGKNITITSMQNDTYQFMERVDANKDNPFRNPNKKAWFYRVNERKAAQDKNYRNMILTDALNWLKTVDPTEMKTINAGLPGDMKINLDLDWEIQTARLFDLTMLDPMLVMKASTNIDAKVKIQAMDAARYQIITFSEGDAKLPRAWHFNRGAKPPLIMEVEIGQNKIEALVKFLRSKEGTGNYKQITAELKVFLKSGVPDMA